MNYIKKNKGTVIAIIIFLALVIALFEVKTIFFPNTGKALYGNRLDGIEDVEISKDTYNKVIEELKKEEVSDVKTSLSGKIVKVFITVNDEVDKEKAKSYGAKVLEYFSDKEKAYYDFEIYVTKNNKEATDFPIIGYKHHSKGNISWTKDR